MVAKPVVLVCGGVGDRPLDLVVAAVEFSMINSREIKG